MKDKIRNYIRAGYSGIEIITTEEARAEKEIADAVKSIPPDDKGKFTLWVWSVTGGLVPCEEGQSPIGDTDEPVMMLGAISKLPERSIVVAKDFHLLLDPVQPNAVLVRAMKDMLSLGSVTNRVLITVGCRSTIPPELRRLIVSVQFDLPGRDDLLPVLEQIAKTGGVTLTPELRDKVLDAGIGMTTTEFENSCANCLVTHNDLLPEFIQREKVHSIKMGGVVEVVETTVTLDQMGGNAALKQDLIEGKELFSREAKAYGLDTPRPKLLLGAPGVGKSLCALAMRSLYQVELLRIEAGGLFAGLVGASEANYRHAFATAKAIAPCILWIN